MPIHVDPASISVNSQGQVVIDDDGALKQIHTVTDSAHPLTTNTGECGGSTNFSCTNQSSCTGAGNTGRCTNNGNCVYSGPSNE